MASRFDTPDWHAAVAQLVRGGDGVSQAQAMADVIGLAVTVICLAICLPAARVLAREFATAGYRIIGVDIDPEKAVAWNDEDAITMGVTAAILVAYLFWG